MSGSSSEERKLDPAVVMVAHAPDADGCCVECSVECGSCCSGVKAVAWPCMPHQTAQAWTDEYLAHTAALERNNALLTAYANLEQQYLAVSDAHASLVDQLSALAAGAIR